MQKILIIKDDKFVRENFGEWLSMPGFQSWAAKDSEIKILYKIKGEKIVLNIINISKENNRVKTLCIRTNPTLQKIDYIFC